MGLKIAPTNGLTRELPILDDFRVQVRYLSRREIERLYERINALDAETQALEAAKAFIAGWSGCKPATVRCLGLNVTDDNANGDGQISFDADNARDLWRNIPANRFSAPIMNFSGGMLAVVEAEKEQAKNA